MGILRFNLQVKMNVSKKKIIRIMVAVVTLVMIAGFVFWPNGYVQRLNRHLAFIYMKKVVNDIHHQAHLRRVLLLCETDDKMLLKAGREIISQIPNASLNPKSNGINHLGNLKFVLPEDIRIPQIIRDLKPYVCLISYDGYLTLEMHGGWDHIKREMSHFGVNIYPENYKEPERNFQYGDRELLPGLWYYDEGYHYGPEEYDKRIDELIREHVDNNK